MKTTPSPNHLMEQTPSHQMNGIVLGATAVFITLLLLCTGIVVTLARAEETEGGMTLPVISAETHGLQPLLLNGEDTSRHQPDPRLPALVQHLPNIAASNSDVTQQIVIRNDEAYTRRITVTQQLPVGLEPATDGDWNRPENVQWNSSQRQWTWTGEIGGGDRDYIIDPTTTDIPYLDLATFGITNLCDQFSQTDENEVTTVSCDDEMVTLNIGRQGQSILLYGVAWRSLTLHADGFASFGDDATQPAIPQIFPNQHHATTVAPLHADFDLSYTKSPTSTTQIGRWHAAVVADYLDGRDTLFVQWHNAPLATDQDATARFALAIPLWSDNEVPPEIETVFYIYDNISHPSRLVSAEYNIGVQDGVGERGMSYAHSVNGDVRGYPPSPSVLQLRPIRYGDLEASTKRLTLQWRVAADVPTNLVSTIELTSDSDQSPLQSSWDTQYLAVRHQVYLPAIMGSESATP